ncbi:D-2-hydroxyacid dehydrogenase [Oceanobacillus sp. FSL K6-2867]|uniref:D-2-hydroxyacid dehydrogenase n=1 Tax=Oceanobacillus sp. FSL K6-2867 TaxID=2954748 RepID=UPI0030D6FD3B
MILFSAKISDKHQEKLKQKYSNQRFLFSESDEMTKEYLAEAEVLVTYGSDVNEQTIQYAPNLKWIMVLSAGVDELPAKLIREKEILVTNARGIHKTQMAEYAISMLLQVYRQEKILIENEQAHLWDKSVKVKEITGRTIVIAGTGAIGQEVARLAKAFQMKTIGVSRRGKNTAYFDENVTNDKLKDVLAEADFLVSVLPRTKETSGFFTDDHFNAMPNHGVFLNMGRGDAVSSKVILRAVHENEIAHAVLDVSEQEPLPKDHPFWSEDKVTITPHISGLSPHYVTRALEIFTKNLEQYLNGGDDYTNKIDLSRGY